MPGQDQERSFSGPIMHFSVTHFTYRQMLLRLPGLLLSEAPVASQDDGLTLVDEDFGDGVVEGDFSSMSLWAPI